jgi:hypothetical protein
MATSAMPQGLRAPSRPPLISSARLSSALAGNSTSGVSEGVAPSSMAEDASCSFATCGKHIRHVSGAVDDIDAL